MIGIDTLEYRDVAKTIDHSLLRPELDLDTVCEGVELALRYDVASATVRPADVATAAELVVGSDVLVSTVVGFPHGSHTTRTKAAETEELIAAGADEIDMVLNIARLISGEDDYDALLEVMNVGVTRIGATATETILEDFKARRAGAAPPSDISASSGAY